MNKITAIKKFSKAFGEYNLAKFQKWWPRN